jgi:hypothetical protein
MLIRALLALAFFATAICGVKGAPRPPAQAALSPQGGAIPSGAVAPDATASTATDEAQDPGAFDAGCTDGGTK